MSPLARDASINRGAPNLTGRLSPSVAAHVRAMLDEGRTSPYACADADTETYTDAYTCTKTNACTNAIAVSFTGR